MSAFGQPFGNHFSLPNFGGGYSNVLSFAEGGDTPLEMLHALKLTENVHPEIQFENAIRHSPELAQMYHAHLRRGLSRIEAMRAVQNEVASRLVGE